MPPGLRPRAPRSNNNNNNNNSNNNNSNNNNNNNNNKRIMLTSVADSPPARGLTIKIPPRKCNADTMAENDARKIIG